MPTEVALAFNKDAGLLLFVDVPELVVVFCGTETVFKIKCTTICKNEKQRLKNKNSKNYYLPGIDFALLLLLLSPPTLLLC